MIQKTLMPLVNDHPRLFAVKLELIKTQGAHRTVKLVFQDFLALFMSIFHVFHRLINRVDIEQVRFAHTFTKAINESTKHVNM